MELADKFKLVLERIRAQEKAYTRIALIGQPGAGKSSLINNLIGKRVAETGPETDVTREEKEYEYKFLRLVDIPGYGTSLFAFDKWIKKYPIKEYDVLLYVCSGKLIEEDIKLFNEINALNNHNPKPLFLVRTHSNSLEDSLDRENVRRDILTHLNVSSHTKVYFVDCGRQKEGIKELDDAIRKAKIYELWKKRVIKCFEVARDSYLTNSFQDSEDKIDTYKKIAGANGMNPFLGADLAVDVGIYLKMFFDIRNCYGISENDIRSYLMFPVAKKLAELLTKQGIVLLVKSFGTRFVAKNILKYIPFAGQVASATIGWKMAKCAGDDYNAECHSFAKNVMNKLIDEEVKRL